MQFSYNQKSKPNFSIRNAASMIARPAAYIAMSVLMAACSSSGSNSVDDALKVTPPAGEQQVASVPQPDKIQDPRAYCPKTVLRAGTETYNLYPKNVKSGDEGASAQLLYRGSIGEVVRECTRAGAYINIKVGVRGRYLTGPKGQPGSFDMPVRIAVTRGDEVLYSQLHQVPAIIEPGRTNGAFSYVDNNITIPIPEHENIIIYVGYDEGPYDTK